MYQLPDLKFAYDALEPVLTAEMLELHYTKHHAGYIQKLNDLLQQTHYPAPKDINEFIATMDFSRIPLHYRDVIQFNAGGHANHCFFWDILKPCQSKVTIPPALESALNQSFQSLENFKKEFERVAAQHLGSGWAWLCVSPNKELVMMTTLNHDHPQMPQFKGTPKAGMPVLTLDLWEHAYYLKYKNQKLKYFEAFWDIVDWNRVAQRYQEAIEKH
ncbi:MAG: superoxide dismutase [Opitutales bacterium]|nr:superoxide dismutase [Opitutales bacterium]